MKFTSVRVLTTNEGSLLTYTDITIDNCFRVSDLKNFRRPPGYFVPMPQVSGNSRKATLKIHQSEAISRAVAVTAPEH